ncbi:MAG: hypothetical protein ACLFNU_10220 [Bacteroidales bacterium]
MKISKLKYKVTYCIKVLCRLFNIFAEIIDRSKARISIALDDRDTKMRALKAGANDVVYKPINKKDFHSKLAGIIDVALD